MVIGSESVTTDANGIAVVSSDDSGENQFISVVVEGYDAYVNFQKLIPGGVVYVPLYLSKGEDLKLVTATAQVDDKTTNLLNDKLHLFYNSENIQAKVILMNWIMANS